MTAATLSTLGLVLSIVPVLLHGSEMLYPAKARLIVNWVLPFFAPMLPDRAAALDRAEQEAMLDAALAAAPKAKSRAAADYLFIVIFEQRQGALLFASVAAGAVYGLTLGVADRDGLHFVFGVIAVLMILVNANQAGLPVFGTHPRMSTNGRHVGIVFTPFWAGVAALNWIGFAQATAL